MKKVVVLFIFLMLTFNSSFGQVVRDSTTTLKKVEKTVKKERGNKVKKANTKKYQKMIRGKKKSSKKKKQKWYNPQPGHNCPAFRK